MYGKAALFFNALYEALGDEKFNQFMQEYFQTYRYGVAYPKDFLAIAAKYAGQAKLDELVKEWIRRRKWVTGRLVVGCWRPVKRRLSRSDSPTR